ncbi:kunitz-type trypsin inhibitor-like 2 protein, partial [Vigna unguiculata]|uniref:kunitz-type trypsin inhibitor-like 2 protein n=1 Tax=Vigna unguiculata TaxID=3917 RepID=UPI001016A87C
HRGNRSAILHHTINPWPTRWRIETCQNRQLRLVLQDFSEVFRGRSVKFTTGGDSTVVLTGQNLVIEFVNKPECAESGKWEVILDFKFPVPYVGISAQQRVVSGSFQIQKYRFGVGYKLVFCRDGGETCLNIGRFDAKNGEDGTRLRLDDPDPFDVVFVEAFEDK